VTAAHAYYRPMLLIVAALFLSTAASGQTDKPDTRPTWKPVPFAILKFNDEAPKSWNIYHAEKRGVLLVRLWKRYLFVDLAEQQVFDLDPAKLSMQGDDLRWSLADLPEKPIDTLEWKSRDVGPVERVTFRLGKDGHILELQLPLRPGGKPMY
jgi:hypothetical protein